VPRVPLLRFLVPLVPLVPLLRFLVPLLRFLVPLVPLVPLSRPRVPLVPLLRFLVPLALGSSVRFGGQPADGVRSSARAMSAAGVNYPVDATMPDC